MAYADFEYLTVQRAKQRGIIPNATPDAQLTSMVNQLGALVHASNEKDRSGVREGVGDLMSTLIIFCAMSGINLTSCLAESFDSGKHDTSVLLPSGARTNEEQEN